jgi:hypothetical protein
LVRFEFKSGIVLFCFSFIFVSFEESYLLVSWCAGGRCGMVYSDEDHGKSRRPGVEDWGWSHRSGTRWPAIKRLGGAVYGLHRACEDEEPGLLG